MIVRIMPLAPEIPVPGQQRSIKTRTGTVSVGAGRSISANSMLGFCGSLPLSTSSSSSTCSNMRRTVSAAAEFQLLNRRYNGLGGNSNSNGNQSHASRKRPRPNSDIGVPVRISSSNSNSSGSEGSRGGAGVPLTEIKHRHSLKLEPGSSGEMLALGEGGFNIRLGQSSRWSFKPSGGSRGSSKNSNSKPASVGGKPRPSHDRDFGISPLPSSPKRPKHWAPAPRRDRAGIGASQGQGSSSNGSSPSTSASVVSAPAWLEHEHEEDEDHLPFSLSDADADPEFESDENEGVDDSDTDNGDEDVLNESVDSGIDSIETQKEKLRAHLEKTAERHGHGRKVAVPACRGRSQREIYGLPLILNEDADNGPDVFPESFYAFQRNRMARAASERRVDHFSSLPDEMIMKVLAWLPKPALGRMAQVSKRFNRVASDESLWTHIDCQGKNLSWEEVDLVMQHKPMYWRMARANVYATSSLQPLPVSPQLAFLDLSMIIAAPAMLNALLGACPGLVKLSLEHLEVTPEMLTTAAATFGHSLEVLNLAMCYMVKDSDSETAVGGGPGAGAASASVDVGPFCNLLTACPKLKALNMGCVKQEWSQSAITRVMSSFPTGLEQLNVAGFRLQLTDTHIQVMASRCPGLAELDISDSQAITMMAIEAVSHLGQVQHLALSRCYSVEAESYELLRGMKSLRYLELFSIFKDESVELLTDLLPGVTMNQYPFCAIARPTFGQRRSSIWGQRVRN